MKKVLYFVFLACLSFEAAAQNLTLNYNGIDVSNSEITVNGLPTADYIKAIFLITNTTASTINVMVKRRVIEELAGSFNSFCLGNCYPPETNETDVSFPLAAGATSGNDDFYIQFLPEGNTGTSKIEYEVYNEANVDDKVTVIVNFNISLTGVSTLATNSSLNINSNSSGTTVSYSLLKQSANSKLIITNILGVRQFELPINEQTGRIELPTENLPRGIYICSLQTQGRTVVAKKFVVSK